MSPPGIELATARFPTGRLKSVATGTNVYFKLFSFHKPWDDKMYNMHLQFIEFTTLYSCDFNNFQVQSDVESETKRFRYLMLCLFCKSSDQ